MQLEATVGQREAVADCNAVGGCILLRKPEAVGARLVIFLAGNQMNARNLLVCGHGERKAVARKVLDVGIDAQVPCGLVHTAKRTHLGLLVCGKAAFGDDAVVCIAGFFKKRVRIFLDAHPFHIEADKYAGAEGGHKDHGDELRLVGEHRPIQLAQKHTIPSLPVDLVGRGG